MALFTRIGDTLFNLEQVAYIELFETTAEVVLPGGYRTCVRGKEHVADLVAAANRHVDVISPRRPAGAKVESPSPTPKA